MSPLPTFLGPTLPSLHPTFPSHHSRLPIHQTHPRRPRFIPCAASTPPSTPTPDAGLTSSPNVTGTVCANLWPLPIFGRYGWFLNVYDRAVAAKVGAFVVRGGSSQQHPLTLSFSAGDKPTDRDKGSTHAAFPGVATGNLNVAKTLAQLADKEPVAYALKFFEKGGAEAFWKRRNEVHVENQAEDDSELLDAWSDPAPTFQVVSRASMYEVRQMYSGVGAAAQNASKFEYFAMNLFPVWPFAKYSCFVCVWQQRDSTAPIAIDKVDGNLRLSFFDPLELPMNEAEENMPPAIASFAVKVFFGAVTDAIVANQQKVLLAAIAASPSTRPVSDTAFRIVVDNKPGVLTPNRRNELWVQVE